jgi:hypothetical protein
MELDPKVLYNLVDLMSRTALIFSLFVMAFAIVGCGSSSTLYSVGADGRLHKITSKPAEMVRYEIIRYAEIEAKGVRPPAPTRTWREYWTKVVAYWPGWQEFGTHEQVMAFIAEQRHARGLPPL